MNQRFVIAARTPSRAHGESSTTPVAARPGRSAVRRAAWGSAPALPPASAAGASYHRGPRSLFEGLESRTYLSVTTNAQGWTVVTPSADTRTIYVSTSGSDGNTGLSPSSPVLTVTKARTLVRNNTPDQILFRRGDTFFGTSITGWNLSGRSEQEPFVLGAYTDPAAPSTQRPKFATGIATGFQSSLQANAHVFIMGLAFEAHLRNYRQPPANNTFTTAFRSESDGGTNGIRITNAFDDLLIEDCSFQYYKHNLTVQSTTVNGVYREVSDVRIRRSVISDAYVTNIDETGNAFFDAACGIYAEGVERLTMDGNVMSHNGWIDDNALGAVGNIFSHGAYINSGNDDFVFVNNIVSDSGSHGIQARAGGIIKDNLFLRNPVAISYGYMNGGGVFKSGGVYGEVSGNVVVGTSRIVDSPRGYGIELGNLRPAANGGGTVVRNNVFANDTAGGNQYAIKLDVGNVTGGGSPDAGINDLRLENNIVYSWAFGMFIHPSLGTGSLPLNNLTVKGNDFQRMFASGQPMIDHRPAFNSARETWTNNRYDGLAGDSSASRWFRVGSTSNQITLAQWQASYEPTAIRATGSFVDPGRSAATYNASIGGTGTMDAFMAEALKQSKSYWRTKYTPAAVNPYIRAGYAGGRVDTAAPTATADADNVTVGGDATQTFTVTYSDDDQVNGATLGDGDVIVTGPNGYVAAATFVSATRNAEGDRRTVTYTVGAPGGEWSATANGIYLVSVAANQVADASGKFAVAGVIGTFSVGIDPAVPSAVAVVPAVATDTAPATVTVTYTGRTSPGLPTVVTPLNAGFEAPNVGANDFFAFAVRPGVAESGWNFYGLSGITGNGSGFTYDQVAPQGGQVAFLQADGLVEQSVDGWQAGTYTLSFKAAQQTSNAGTPHDVGVFVDGLLVTSFSPTSTAYQTFVTTPFTVGAGVHTVRLAGLDFDGGYETTFVDDVQIVGNTAPQQQQVAAFSLDGNDVRLSGTGYSAAAASAVATDGAADANRKTVVYTFPAPADGWSSLGLSSLNVNVAAGQVFTTSFAAVPAAKVGTLRFSLTAPDATVNAADAAVGSTAPHTFTVSYASAAGIPLSAVGNDDLRVLGPGAYNQPATLLSAAGAGTAASPLVATYSVPAPAAGWVSSASGTYSVVAQTNAVVDAQGNALAAGAVGQFKVAVDTSAPLVTVSSPAAPTVALSTTAGKTVTVNYYDASGMNAATFDGNDVRVTGPLGYSQPGVKTSVTQSGNGYKVVYTFAAPATTGWKSRHNGTYTLTLNGGQVTDALGNTWGTAKTLGTFDVALETVPPTVAVAAVSPNPRGTAVPSATITFSEEVYGFDLSDLTLTRDGVAVSLAGATLTAVVDNAATPPKTLYYTLGNLSGLTAAGGTYALSVKPGGLEDAAGNVSVSGSSTSWVTDVTAPTASATSTGVSSPGTTPALVTVNYFDAGTGVSTATIDPNDLLVTGPGGFLPTVTVQSVGGSVASRSVVYAVQAPAGGWKSAYNGTYTVSLRSGQVADAVGNVAAPVGLGSFNVSLETTPPTVAVAAVAPNPRVTPVSSLTVNFSEAVAGFDLSDVSLTRDGVPVSLASATLTTANNASFTVGGLASATTTPGSYQFAVAGASAGVTDAAGNALAAGASTAFVVNAPVDGVRDGGFEEPSVGAGQFAYAPAGSLWSFEGYAGLAANDSAVTAGNPPAPTGTQAAFIQLTAAVVQRGVAVSGGTYVVNFAAAQRGNWGSPTQSLRVLVDGVPLLDATPAGAAYESFTTAPIDLAAGNHEIRFQGLNPTGGDELALLDAVSLSPVGPSVVWQPVATPRHAPVDVATFTLTEPVNGLDPSDLTLTRDGLPVDTSGIYITLPGGMDVNVNGLAAATAAPGSYKLTLRSVGTGITNAAGQALTGPATVSWVTDATVPLSATATVDPAAGRSATLSATVSPSTGKTFAWSVLSAPAGAPAVTFSANGSESAASTTATFGMAGTYTFLVTTTDASGATESATATAAVAARAGTVTVTPGSATVAVNGTQQFAASATDQFGWPMTSPAVVWTTAGGSGTISSTGLYSAGSTGGTTNLVWATSGSAVGQAVVSVSAAAFKAVKIDFAPTSAALASGYIRDSGLVAGDRGNGYRYGWNVSHADTIVDRNKDNANQLQDTSAGMKSASKWSLTVPNGKYTVKVGAGDSSIATTNTVRVEGITAFSATKLNAKAYSTKTLTVTVYDGVLTIDNGSAANLATRLTHVEVSPVPVTTTPTFTSAMIDFAPNSGSLAAGYQLSAGGVYGDRGNGFTHGWSVSHAATSYDRNKASTQLLDTVVAVKKGATWNLLVPNGTYSVKVGVGDAAAKSTNTVTLEGKTLFSAVALNANVFSSKTMTVTVSDGKLTLGVGAAADLATRLTHIEVTKV